MLTLSNVESRRILDLVAAFEEQQITLSELQEGLTPVSSEALQVVALFGGVPDAFEVGIPRSNPARLVIRGLASATRCRC